jgi:hypothetical protein
LANFLGSSYNVIGISKPNADLKAITSTINMRLGNLMKKALVIICGKTRDIAKNESKIGLKHLMQLAKSTCNINVIVISAPWRFDLQPFSCVNKEVTVFNRKLLKLMPILNHLQTCNVSLNRIHYNTHTLHMDNLG